MSRHAAEGGALINSMVGVAVASVLVPEVEHLVQADDFPNLYWALSALGSPLIDIATPIDHERLWIFSEFPYSSKLSTTILSKAQAQDLKASATKFLDFVNGSGTDSVLPNELKVAAYSMLAYPEAKAALVERGYDVEKVELMPVAQVIVLNGLEHYASFLDESVVIARLPYFKAFPLADRLEARVRAINRTLDVPLYSFAPPVQEVLWSAGRLDRSIAQLIVVEAIRNYMAEHEGRLPKSLSDITALPVPDDPITGKPFPYRLEGATATLDATAMGSMIITRYRISASASPKHSNIGP